MIDKTMTFSVNDEKEEVLKILKDGMESAYKMCVPLVVDLQTGDNWYEAK